MSILTGLTARLKSVRSIPDLADFHFIGLALNPLDTQEGKVINHIAIILTHILAEDEGNTKPFRTEDDGGISKPQENLEEKALSSREELLKLIREEEVSKHSKLLLTAFNEKILDMVEEETEADPFWLLKI